MDLPRSITPEAGAIRNIELAVKPGVTGNDVTEFAQLKGKNVVFDTANLAFLVAEEAQ